MAAQGGGTVVQKWARMVHQRLWAFLHSARSLTLKEVKAKKRAELY